jgi:hypothetical protein
MVIFSLMLMALVGGPPSDLPDQLLSKPNLLERYPWQTKRRLGDSRSGTDHPEAPSGEGAGAGTQEDDREEGQAWTCR